MNIRFEKGGREIIINGFISFLDYYRKGDITHDSIVFDIDTNEFKKVSEIEEISIMIHENKDMDIKSFALKKENKTTLIKRMEPFLVLFVGIIFTILPCFKSNGLIESAESKASYMLGMFIAGLAENIILSGVIWVVVYLIKRKKMKMTRSYLFIIIFGIVSFALYSISR